MTASKPKPVTIKVGETQRVSGLLLAPPQARALLRVRARRRRRHGASVHGRGRDRTCRTRHRELALSISVYGAGGKRPDPPKLAQAAVRAAVTEAARLVPSLPLIAGGKSFGGRMTSQAQAASPLPGVRGLAFLGFPLHPAGKPSDERAEHLSDVKIPMLFLQGTRDALADVKLLKRRRQTARRARDAHAVRGRRPFLPCAGAQRAQGCRCAARDAGCVRGMDARR